MSSVLQRAFGSDNQEEQDKPETNYVESPTRGRPDKVTGVLQRAFDKQQQETSFQKR